MAASKAAAEGPSGALMKNSEGGYNMFALYNTDGDRIKFNSTRIETIDEASTAGVGMNMIVQAGKVEFIANFAGDTNPGPNMVRSLQHHTPPAFPPISSNELCFSHHD